ncbi:MAG TPA: glutamine--fructose-6-phosphate transaminase (isomerizing) [Fimbriimonadales bacterium]|nr:glutamine--fructose-6-phosphate transaminase (isomerizing) [Fimbriimonadales bacterium]
MCGIAGYIGPREAVSVVFDQITRLEYRGYDSAGIAFRTNNKIDVLKSAGKLRNLRSLIDERKPSSHIAMAHSRWATHGAPTDSNAHPHYDQNEKIAVIHNGIIENYYELTKELKEKGHVFRSETDTEVAAHVIGEEYEKCGQIVEAVRRAIRRFRGAFAMVVLCVDEPDKIVAVRNASPLVIGIGKGENFLASDIPALLPYTREVIILEEGDLAVLTQNEIYLEDAESRPKLPNKQYIDWDIEAAEKGGYEHFMIKEIHEQPIAIRQCLSGRLLKDGSIRLPDTFSVEEWKRFERFVIVACGTAYNAGLLGKYIAEGLLRIPVEVQYASEFRYNNPILHETDLVIVISQSGETADTIAALRLAKEKGIKTLGIVNVVGSTVAREVDAVLYTQAGPEICVASTKAYTAQATVLTLIALYLGHLKNTDNEKLALLTSELQRLPDLLDSTRKLDEPISKIAEKIYRTNLMFFLGRGADAAVAMEGALKMKEIAYIPTQESPTGEMKHGPLALVEPGVVAIFGSTNPLTREKVISNIKEIKARGGTTVAILLEGDSITTEIADYAIHLPHIDSHPIAALVSVMAYQFLAYHVARLRGCDIDQPRNLAKSVTVE